MSDFKGEAWSAIREGNSIVEGLIAQKHYKEAMINARGTLQTMVTDLCERNGIEERNLVDMINALNERGVIDDNTYQHYNKIRMLGNRAMNEDDNSAYNAQQAHHLLSQETYAYANMVSGRGGSSDEEERPARASRPAAKTASAAPAGRPSVRAASAASAERPAAKSQGAKRPSAGEDGPSPDLPFEKDAPAAKKRPASGAQRSTSSMSAQDRPRKSSAQRTTRTSQRNISRGPAIDPGSIIKPLLLLAIIIVLIIIVRLIKPAKEQVPETTEPVTVEEVVETEPVTEAETEPPAPVMVKTTDRVRLRATPSTDDANNVLATVDAGTVLEFVRDENEEWAVVTVNGAEVYVSKQYIQPAQ